jgi:hypothetical protein
VTPDDSRKRIFNVLKAAHDDHESKLQVSPIAGAPKTVTIEAVPDRHHTIKIKLTWSVTGKPHYIGRFIDDGGTQSRAILSLYNQFDAAQFVVAMNLLADLAAKSKHEKAKH